MIRSRAMLVSRSSWSSPFVATALFFLLPLTVAEAQDVRAPYGASYNTNWGKVTFQGSGARLVGTYPSDSGRIVGTLRNQVLSGYWTETSSNRECETEFDGTRYWGRVELRFNSDYSLFEGPWGYCNLMSDGTWSGTLDDPSKAGACGALIAKRDRLNEVSRDLMDRKLPEELLRELAIVLREIREAITGTETDAEEAAKRINEAADATSGLADGVAGILQRIATEAIAVLAIADEVTAFFDDIIPELESWADRLERTETADAADTIRELRDWFDELRERLPMDQVPGLGVLLEQYSNAMGAAADDAGRWEQRVREHDQLFRDVAGRSLYSKARGVREQLADARQTALAALEDVGFELEQADCLKLPPKPGICDIPHGHIDRVVAAARETTARDRSWLSELMAVHGRLKQRETLAWEAQFALEERMRELGAQLANRATDRKRITDEIQRGEEELRRLNLRALQASELSRQWGADVLQLQQAIHRQVERELARTPWTDSDRQYLEHCMDEKYVPPRR